MFLDTDKGGVAMTITEIDGFSTTIEYVRDHLRTHGVAPAKRQGDVIKSACEVRWWCEEFFRGSCCPSCIRTLLENIFEILERDQKCPWTRKDTEAALRVGGYPVTEVTKEGKEAL